MRYFYILTVMEEGNTTGGYHNAKLSATDMRHSQRMKTYHVTHKYRMSTDNNVYIEKFYL